MILVTGASGKSGKAVIRALVRKGAEARAFVHRAERVAEMRAIGAADVVVGDLRDGQALEEAMQEVGAVYHICPAVQPDEAAIGKGAIDAACRVGVGRFVFHSVLHPQTEALPHHIKKLHVETYLIQSGIPFTILQPGSYMQNILDIWERIERDGVYAVPYGVTARLSLVDLDDVGEAAGKVLTEDGHDYASYELSGPATLTAPQIATILEKQLGRPVQAVDFPLDQWEQRARAGGFGDYSVKTLLTMFRHYAKQGLVGNPNIISWLLGRPPTDYAAFVERTLRERRG